MAQSSPLEAVQATARDLCADTWLANRINLELKMQNGKQVLDYQPAESLPYVRAAYAIRKDDLPAEMRGLFDAAS